MTKTSRYTKENLTKVVIKDIANHFSLHSFINKHKLARNGRTENIIREIIHELKNNFLCNLQLLCGNCDSQSPTYRVKNTGNGRGSRKNNKIDNNTASFNYSDDALIKAISSSFSINEVKVKLNYKSRSNSSIRRRIHKLKLSTAHFKRKFNFNIKIKVDINDYLSNKKSVDSSFLRRRLIAEGYFEEKCYSCGLTHWNNQPITLELEHKNGDHFDNSLSNLSIICPTCHAATDTYAGKNIKLRKAKSKLV